jgi:hypothetical protein
MQTKQQSASRRFTQTALVLGIIASVSGSAPAQVEYLPEKDEGPQAVVAAAQKIKPAPPTSSNSATEMTVKNILTEKLDDAEIQTGWDTTRNRYAQVAFYEFQVDPQMDLEDYFAARQIAALGAIVRAQVDLARWLGAEAGINISIQNPGDPFFADKKHAKDLQEIEARLSQARKDAEKQGLRFEKAEDDAFRGVRTADRIKVAADALVKKLDANYESKAVAEEKNAKARELKASAQAARDKLAQLEQEYEQYRENYQKKSTQAGIELTYDHVIFGLSAVCWAENLTSDGKLQMGMAYVWSPRLARSAHAALVGDPAVDSELVKGEEDVKTWIKKQDLATFGTTRFFVDNNGDRWFLGSALVPNSLDEATTVAQLDATLALFMPLYSKLQGKQVRQLSAKSGKLGSSFAQGLYEDLKSFASHNTRGLNQLRNVDIKWTVRNVKTRKTETIPVSAVIMGLNAKSADDALKANVQMALAAAAVERENNRRRLEQAQLNQVVETAKKETPASSIPALMDQPTPSGKAQAATAAQPQASAQGPAPKLAPNPGTKVNPAKPQDDF